MVSIMVAQQFLYQLRNTSLGELWRL